MLDYQTPGCLAHSYSLKCEWNKTLLEVSTSLACITSSLLVIFCSFLYLSFYVSLGSVYLSILILPSGLIGDVAINSKPPEKKRQFWQGSLSNMGTRPSGLSSTEQGAPSRIQLNQDGSVPPNTAFSQQSAPAQGVDYGSDAAFVTAAGSAFLNDSKPSWGWDFILSFKLPKTLRAKLTSSASSAGKLGNGDHCVDMLDAEEEENDDDDDDDFSGNDGNLPDHSGTTGHGRCASLWCGRSRQSTTEVGQVLQQGHGRRRHARHTKKRVEILARLKSAGFVFSQLVVPSENVILVRLSLPERQLKQKAVHIGLELRLKEQYGSGFLSYEIEQEHTYMNDHHKTQWNCFFSPSERAVIILSVLQSKEHWGCDLNLEKLVYDQTVLQAFALHSERDRKRLVKRAVWARWWDPTWKPPFAELKDYLGGKLYSSFFPVLKNRRVYDWFAHFN